MRLPDPVDGAMRHPNLGGQLAELQCVSPSPGGFSVLATIWARLRAVMAGGRQSAACPGAPRTLRQRTVVGGD